MSTINLLIGEKEIINDIHYYFTLARSSKTEEILQNAFQEISKNAKLSSEEVEEKSKSFIRDIALFNIIDDLKNKRKSLEESLKTVKLPYRDMKTL